MRITNGIMINNSLSNINKNKTLMDKLKTQIETTKKIQRPSDDPIAAIRALRLRSMEAEINQYLEKNIEDAEAWMEVTDDALDSLNKVVTDITAYYNQGVSEYQTTSDREKIITTLRQFKAQLYADGNADNAGRTIFTGYRTDQRLTFDEEVDDEYEITESLKFSNLREINKVIGVDTESAASYRETDVTNDNVHVVMLAYTDLNAEAGLTLHSDTNDILNGAEVQVRSYNQMGAAAYHLQDDEVVFIPETGELLFGGGYYDEMSPDDTFNVTYTKNGFKKGDIKPEHYYYCTNNTKGVTYGTVDEETGMKYCEDQQIEYNINFNQKLTINVQAKDVLTADLGRDLDITIAAAQDAVLAHKKVEAVQKKIDAANTAGDLTEVKRLNAMLSAAQLEVSYAEDNLTKSFSRGITLYQNHQSDISTQLSDLGSRMNRLTLNRDRLESQSLTVQELKSSNEDTNLTDAAAQLAEASSVYDASLMAAAKVVQKSLLDFL